MPQKLPLNANEIALFVAIVVVVLLAGYFDELHNYWTDPWSSVRDIARHTALLGIFSLGAAVVIISGGIDLSSGSMIAFSGTICATIMLLIAPQEMATAQPLGVGVICVAIVGTLVVGFLVGSLHAWLITIVGLPPFIATLASLVGLRSLGRVVCENVTAATPGLGKSSQIQIFDDRFRYLATSVWIPVVLFIVLSIAVWLLLSKTVVGRHIYAIGGNEEAARLSGIRTEKIKWLAYCIGTLTATIAGILYVCDQSVADPQTLGRAYELNAIAAAVVGGCSLQGGVGTVLGTVLGALFLRTVIDGIAKIIKSGADVYEGLIVGIVVVVAVALSTFRERVRLDREVFPGALGVVSLLTLVVGIGTLSTLMAGGNAGIVAAVTALVVLGVVRFLEVRRRHSG